LDPSGEITGNWRKLHNENFITLLFTKYYLCVQMKEDGGGMQIQTR
jgi:hypothetical protein